MSLLQLSGFGVMITMTVLSAIGNITRFESAKKLVGYAGLGAGVHDSVQEHIEKLITKSGCKELRWAMVEACFVSEPVRQIRTESKGGNSGQTMIRIQLTKERKMS